jgi:hypothetical protein
LSASTTTGGLLFQGHGARFENIPSSCAGMHDSSTAMMLQAVLKQRTRLHSTGE